VKSSIYDKQAYRFDKRAGLAPDTCDAIVDSISSLGLGKQSIFEIACGTGQLGIRLQEKFSLYVGMDLSAKMLEQFQGHRKKDASSLILADGNQAWPIATGSADIIFSSRGIHWLDVEHTVAEARRVARTSSCLFIVGRVEKAENSWEARLRRQCHLLLKLHHLTPRDGQQHLRKLQKGFQRELSDTLRIEKKVVSRWNEKKSLQQFLENWANKEGLAGTLPNKKIKHNILSQLKHWAQGEYGSNLPRETRRHYVLNVIYLNPDNMEAKTNNKSSIDA